VTASRIEAVFDIERSAVLSSEQKRRLRSRFGPRVTAVAQDARSQTRNRELALERLRERIATALRPRKRRRATKPRRAARERRLADKRRRAETKRRRRRPIPGAED
jgi:ribosome-associated protein